MLSSFKVSTLHQISLLCGLTNPAGANKSARIQHLTSGLRILDKIKPRSNTLCAIDVGLKNLSYCVILNVSIDESDKSQISSWIVDDLHDRYGNEYVPINSHSVSSPTMLDSRRYLNFLASNLACEITTSKPDCIVIETQRTRSNTNSVTLPTIMQNYTFENMLFSNIHAQNPGVTVWPMAAAQMTAFWVNRFVTKESLKAVSKNNSKSIRHRLFVHWLTTNQLFDVTRILPGTLPNGDLYGKAWLPNALGLSAKKLDDLIDSLLYCLTLQWQLRNAHELSMLVKWGSADDIHDFVENSNRRQIDWIRPVIEETSLELTSEFQKYL